MKNILLSVSAVLLSGFVVAADAVQTVALRPGTKTEISLKSPSDDGKTVRVTFPKGVVTNRADIVVNNAAKATVELDGRGTTYVMPKPEKGGVWGPAFAMSAGKGSLFQYDYNGFEKSAVPGTFRDFRVRVAADEKTRMLAFDEGTFDFGPTSYIKLFTGEPGSEACESVIEIGPKAKVSTPTTVAFHHPSLRNTLRVRGGVLELPGAILTFARYWGTRAKTEVPRAVAIEVTDGGLFRFGRSPGVALSIGATECGSTSNVTFSLVADRGRIEQIGEHYVIRPDGPGCHVLALRNGSAASFASTVSLGTVPGATGEVMLDNSSLTLGHDLRAGGAGSRFFSDGGRIVCGAKIASHRVCGFGKFELGAGGLAIDSDGAVVVEQTVENAAGAKGALKFSGAGKKKVVGDVRVARIEATGGAVEITGACTAEVVSKEGAIVSVGGKVVSLGGCPNEDILLKFADRSKYEIVQIRDGKGYDLAMTTNRPGSTFWFHRHTNSVCTAVVPCEEFTHAWVLCSVDPALSKDRHFTVRLTRYANAPKEHYRGRSRRGMADTHVDFDAARKEKLSDGRYLVEVPLGTGDIQDILYVDNHGNANELAAELGRLGVKRYLDLELLGRTATADQPLHASTQNVDPKKPSAVTVYDVILERPPCEMRMLWTQPGNIFHNDEVPETKVVCTVHRPGKHVLSWTVRNPEDEIVQTGSLNVTASGTNTISLAQKELGWYKLDWELKDGDRTMLTHSASFALLGKDTRTTGCGEPPYGCGGAAGDSHYRIPDKLYDVQGPLFYKAGFRRCFWCGMPVEKAHQWKVGPAVCARFPSMWNPWRAKPPTDDELKAQIARTLKDFPAVTNCMIFHEDAPEAYRQAEEIFGGTHGKDMAGAQLRYDQAMRASQFMRTNFPNVHITVGNSLACSELVADLMRRGFPKANIDYMGLESVVRENLPERITSSALQGADMMRETAKHFGYPWKPNACFESDYRRHSVIGYDRQAMWYVRDLLLQQCWRFPDIYVSDLVTVGNHYAESFWGDAGVCERWPMLYPFKGYVGLAVATKVLDRVRDRIHIPTGDGGTFLVAFPRADGKVAYAFWTARGEADIELETTAKFGIIDFFGRTRQPESASKFNWVPGKAKRFVVHATEWAGYIVADGPIVKRARAFAQCCPGDRAIADTYRTVADTRNIDAWTVSNNFACGVARPLGKYPARIAGKGVARAVDDPEMGRVIELELVEPDYSLPVNVDEFTTLILKKPIKVEGRPSHIGAWVKGNAGWGGAYFIIADSHGRICSNSGLAQYGEMDYSGITTVCYSGWHFIAMPMQSWTNWTCATFCDYPFSIVGIAFSAQNRPLILDERGPRRQMIRIGSIGIREGL